MRRHHKRFDTGGGDNLWPIFSTINQQYSGKPKYIITNFNDNPDYILIDIPNGSSYSTAQHTILAVNQTQVLASLPNYNFTSTYNPTSPSYVSINGYSNVICGSKPFKIITYQYDSTQNTISVKNTISTGTNWAMQFFYGFNNALHTQSIIMLGNGKTRQTPNTVTITNSNSSTSWGGSASGTGGRTTGTMLNYDSANGTYKTFIFHNGNNVLKPGCIVNSTSPTGFGFANDTNNNTALTNATLVSNTITNTSNFRSIPIFGTNPHLITNRINYISISGTWKKCTISSDYTNITVGDNITNVPNQAYPLFISSTQYYDTDSNNDIVLKTL